VPKGFVVKPFKEKVVSNQEEFTYKFEGPAGFFTDNPTPIEIIPENTESEKSKTKKKSRQASYSHFAII